MCGFAGLIAKKEIDQSRFNDFIKSSELMNHRGPDFRGIFHENNVMLIHYRLSIIDLDKRSNQPFYSQSKKNVCVYNGEIYNFRDLKEKYSIKTNTTSDTEVMIETFEREGFQSVKDWNGIFATAIYNSNEKTICLIRDRLGIKPLYIFENDEVIAFASEAKVILDWLHSFEINFKGLSQYLWFGNTTGEETIVKGLRKIKPGTITSISTINGQKLLDEKYWSVKNCKSSTLSEKETIEETKLKLEKAVSRQLVSDVSLGVLLSGGIDSSAVVAFASMHSETKIDTYSVAYDYDRGGKNELENARLIAKKFNTNHNELVVTSNNVKEIFCDLVFQHDEPFAEAANIPLYQLGKLCSKSKKVILQGDGGDELFAGYRRYNVLNSFYFWKYSSMLYPFLPKKSWQQRMKRMNYILSQKDDAEIMAHYMSQEVSYQNPYNVFKKEVKEILSTQDWMEDYKKQNELFKGDNIVDKMIKTDANILLPHTYLEKVDKSTMLSSIEARVPFLDNELVDFAYSIPSHLKVKNNQKKYLLKKALGGLIPDEILYGKKNGFNTPIGNWLKKDLYSFAKDSFLNKKNELLDADFCLKILEENKNNQMDYSFLLWKVLVLNTWLDYYKEKYKLVNN